MSGDMRDRMRLLMQEKLKRELLELELRKVKARMENDKILVGQIELLEQRKLRRLEQIMERRAK